MLAAALLVAIFAAAPARPHVLSSAPGVAPSDSLALSLRRLEATPGHPGEGARAALTLGQLHYARGEYRAAADAFARAAARLDPTHKAEARYWAGLSWLALGDPAQARSALEEVAQSASRRRPLALLGIAQAWDLARRPDRALDALAPLIAAAPGDSGPTALALFAALAVRLGRSDEAAHARDRLLRDYPASMEAAGARLAAPETPVAPQRATHPEGRPR